MGGMLSLGAEGASALVRYAESPKNMEESQAIEFTDWGPSVFRMDSVETASDPKSKWPLRMITWMLVAAGITICLCIPFLRALTIFNRHCAVRRLFGIKSPICPSTPHQDTPKSVEDPDEPPAVSMEEYWRGMGEGKHEAEEKFKAKEKKDIGDLVQRIRESVAVKSAEAHKLEKEYIEEK